MMTAKTPMKAIDLSLLGTNYSNWTGYRDGDHERDGPATFHSGCAF